MFSFLKLYRGEQISDEDFKLACFEQVYILYVTANLKNWPYCSCTKPFRKIGQRLKSNFILPSDYMI